MYHTLDTGKNQYKLRLDAKNAVAVEKALGKSLFALFGEGNVNELPTTEQIVTVLHGALQKYHHGISYENAFSILDEYIENGGTYLGMFQELLEMLQVSGFFKAPENKEKNTEKREMLENSK